MAKNPPADKSEKREARQEKRETQRSNRRLRSSARRDVQNSYQPALNSLDRTLEQTGLDYQNQITGVQSIYGGTTEELAKLPQQYDRMTHDIAPDLQQQLQENASLIPGANMPQPEVDAAAGVYGQYGNNAFSQLANNASRNANYNQSAQRESTLSSRYAQQNLLQDMNDQLNEYYGRRQDIYEQMPNQINARMDTLRSDQQDADANEAFMHLLESQIGGMTDQGPGGRTPPRNPGPGPGPGPGDGTNNNNNTNDGPPNREGVNQNPSGLPDKYYQWDTSFNTADSLADLPAWAIRYLNQGWTDTRGEVLQGVPTAGKRRRLMRQNWDDIVRVAGGFPHLGTAPPGGA